MNNCYDDEEAESYSKIVINSNLIQDVTVEISFAFKNPFLNIRFSKVQNYRSDCF